MQKKFNGIINWLIATLSVVYSFCLNTAAAVFANPIKITLHTNSLGVSIAAGAFIVGFAGMQIPAGYLLDRYNIKYVITSGVSLLALGNIVISFADNIFSFSAANILQGIGAAFAFTAAGIIISQGFREKLFPILFGLTQTISCILAAILHYVFTLALTQHSWNTVYKILALCGFILVVLTLIFVKTSGRKPQNPQSLLQSLQAVLQNRNLWLSTIAAMTSFGTILAYASFWYLNVQNYYATPVLNTMIISGMLFIGLGIGTPIWGWISNRIQSRKTAIHISLTLGTIGLLACIYLPHYRINTLIIIKIASLITGFLLAGSMLFYTIVSETSTDKTRGVALSVLNTGVFMFNTLLLFLPYLFLTTSSTLFFTYLWLLPCCVLIAILINYFLLETFSLH